MPIYMDCHFAKGATQRAIADAHEKDLRIQDKYGVRFLTYWLDEERSTTFCLVDAPEKERVTQVHQIAHGGLPSQIIEVDASVVKSFLGRLGDSPGKLVDSAFRAIMFTDLVDFTSTTVRLGDAAAYELLRIHNKLVRKALQEHNGREVKHTGDGFMASFLSVKDSVRCAVAIQKAFAEYNLSHAKAKMHVRIGLSAGEPVEEGGRLLWFGCAACGASVCGGPNRPGSVISRT